MDGWMEGGMDHGWMDGWMEKKLLEDESGAEVPPAQPGKSIYPFFSWNFMALALRDLLVG